MPNTEVHHDSSSENTPALTLLGEACEAETQNLRWEVIDKLEAAHDISPDNSKICFKLAYHLDLVGDEEEARELYLDACSIGRPHINALINLAIVHEDNGEYARAEKCLRQVLDTDPNHDRARLFLKDVQASRQMYYDEEQERFRDKQNSLMETPISDFELSVRARNCLKKMNIRTLGDLLRTSEPELLSYKNFGDTSLQEIKAMLSQKGLRLGQAAESHQDAVRQVVYEQLASTGNEDLLNQPVAELNLSVRARKALSLLNIEIIGDLISRTEAELLGVKNFGSTSLQEIKDRLAERDLSLRVLE